jgi:hypothetical protein
MRQRWVRSVTQMGSRSDPSCDGADHEILQIGRKLQNLAT